MWVNQWMRFYDFKKGATPPSSKHRHSTPPHPQPQPPPKAGPGNHPQRRSLSSSTLGGRGLPVGKPEPMPVGHLRVHQPKRDDEPAAGMLCAASSCCRHCSASAFALTSDALWSGVSASTTEPPLNDRRREDSIGWSGCSFEARRKSSGGEGGRSGESIMLPPTNGFSASSLLP